MNNNIKRTKININGVVQGVGFRPFIHNLAKKHHLTGFIANTSNGVDIEVEGNRDSIDVFLSALKTDAPPLSIITEIHTENIPFRSDQDFIIFPSDGEATATTFIPPDVAVCDDCLKELFDPNDRRYLYPFINCTNCGPRYTIIENIPYDRPNTSMKSFTLCPDCRAEYNNPADRRFHAQPNACLICGPSVSLHDSTGKPLPVSDPIRETATLLNEGYIIAIKGLGGFHLAVNASNNEAVTKLRRRKGREEKPMAVMVGDITLAETLCFITGEEKQLLTSPQHPICLLKKRAGKVLADAVAPANNRYGILLPYTPLHHLLFHHGIKTIVMTSANLSEEPICIHNDEAFRRLQSIVDYFLIHNRDILTRADDSVTKVYAGQPGFIRRSRGYVPTPVILNREVPSVLALGAHLKNTVCITRRNSAFLSQHIGDLDNALANRFFDETIHHLLNVLEVEPEAIVHDLHPDFYSTRKASQFGLPMYAVQHHHAHIASVIAEHQLEDPVIGMALDGFGLGPENDSWGGELLLVEGADSLRIGHFRLIPQPGGDIAAREPWRMAASILYLLGREDEIPGRYPDEPASEMLPDILRKGINCPLTSSCGRLFDAVAGLLHIKLHQSFEGQAPMILESLVTKPLVRKNTWDISDGILDVLPLMENLIDESPVNGANLFHGTLIAGLVEWAIDSANKYHIDRIVLGGGCFLNSVLKEGVTDALRERGLHPYSAKQVPPNDGGLSLGQAWIGAKLLEKEIR